MPRAQRQDQHRSLGRDMQAGGEPTVAQRPLGGEPFADAPHDRHLTLGPGDAA
jgi:hypothetical protein